MREVRAERALCGGATHRMATGATRLFEDLPSALRERVGGTGSGCRLLAAPRRVLLGRLRNHEHRHERMFGAAKLGALAAIYAGLVGAKFDGRLDAWQHVLLAVQIRHPERMDHIARLEIDDDGPADG